MSWFIIHYHCPSCDVSWDSEWDCTCDDECPQCGDDVTAESWEEVPEIGEEVNA